MGLWGEFLGLFVLAPLGMALLLPATVLFPALFALTGVGLVLLHRTPGFAWADLLRGRIDGRAVLLFSAATAASGGAIVWLTAPEAAFGLLREQPALMLMIAVLYPVLSALPQELVYRALFFRRYGALLPAGWGAIWLNAALFALAHLMYWSAIVAAMTFAGGLVFAWAHERAGSFPLAVVLHAVGGVLLFALGLGIYFYSGNVVRPF